MPSASWTAMVSRCERVTVAHTKAGIARAGRGAAPPSGQRGRYRTSRRPGRGRAAGGRSDRVRDPAGADQGLRRRYGSAGNKDDRFDAYVLADTVRTDLRRLTPLQPDTPATIALRSWCRARKDLVAHRVAVANQLRAHLAIALPAAVGLFTDLTRRSAGRSWPVSPPRTRSTRLTAEHAGHVAGSQRYSDTTRIPTVLWLSASPRTPVIDRPTGATLAADHPRLPDRADHPHRPDQHPGKPDHRTP